MVRILACKSMPRDLFYLDGKCERCVTKRQMNPLCVIRFFWPQKLFMAAFILSALFNAGSRPASAKSIAQPPAVHAAHPQVKKSPEGKQKESARAAARGSPRHFDRV